MIRRALACALVFAASNAAGWSPAPGAVPATEEAAYHQACQDYLDNGDLPRAIGVCGLCLKAAPENEACADLLKKAQDRFRRQSERSAEIELALLSRLGPRPPANPKPKSPEQASVSAAAAQRSSQQHYLSGVVYYQKGDIRKAAEEWGLSLQLDPSNVDAAAGIEKVSGKGF